MWVFIGAFVLELCLVVHSPFLGFFRDFATCNIYLVVGVSGARSCTLYEFYFSIISCSILDNLLCSTRAVVHERVKFLFIP